MTTVPDPAAAFRLALLTSPGERQNVDYKSAVAFNSNSDFGLKLIRHILAMANTGGGWIVIGYDDSTLQPDPDHSEDIAATYDSTILSQAVDACTQGDRRIVLVVFMQVNPNTGLTYPIIEVTTFERTPFICRSTKPAPNVSDPILQYGKVYIRRSQAATSEIQSLAEWEDLIATCVSQRRDEFLSEFADLYHRMSTGNPTPPASATTRLSDWVLEQRSGAMSSGDAQTASGYLECAQMLLEPPSTNWNRHILRTSSIATKKHYQDLVRATQDGIEIRTEDFPGIAPVLWYLEQDASCYSVCPLLEDHETPSFNSSAGHPSKSLWFDMTVHRVARALLDSAALYNAMGIPPDAPYLISIRHVGLSGRVTYASSPRYLYYIAQRQISQEDVHERVMEVTQDVVNGQIVNLTYDIIDDLFTLFNFTPVSKELIATIVEETKRYLAY